MLLFEHSSRCTAASIGLEGLDRYDFHMAEPNYHHTCVCGVAGDLADTRGLGCGAKPSAVVCIRAYADLRDFGLAGWLSGTSNELGIVVG